MKQGKVFLFGLLIVYLVAAMAALILLAVSFSNLPDEIGRHQGALLNAYQRADLKRFYLESAARAAFTEAADILYTDQNRYFGESGGEAESGCGYYHFSLWSRRTRDDCLLDDKTVPTRDLPAEHLHQNLEPVMGDLTNQHPLGPFTAFFTLTTEFLPEQLRLRFNAQKPYPVEPILRGIMPGQAVGEVLTSSFGAVEGLRWPRAPSGPLENYKRITSCFGPRAGVGVSDVHMGFDLPSRTPRSAKGGAVVAAADGIVINNPQASTYGTVLIKHPPKTPGGRVLYTRYLHLKNERPTDIKVRQNQPVRAGQIIGYAWDTRAAAPHLHFEVLTDKAGITKTAHMYAPKASDVSGLYALNPVCFFSKKTLSDVIIRPSETQATCAKQADPRTAYCDEYGITFVGAAPENATSPTNRPAPTERLSSVMPSLSPNAPPSASSQKLSRTFQRMHDLDWGQYIIGAATKYTVPQSLLLGIITQESAGQPEAISFTGCCAGLMQLHHLNAQNYARQNNKQGLTELPHATACWQCPTGPNDWQCRNSDCTGTTDTDCRCNANNDDRFNAKRNIYAGAELISSYLQRHAFREDQIAFALAEYNAGAGNLNQWIKETNVRNEDVRWEDVADVLRKKNPQHETLNYVELVLAYCQAWNGGIPCTKGAGNLALSAGSQNLVPIGEYIWNPTFWVDVPDLLTPFADVMDWARQTLQRCENDPRDSERCLLREALSHDPMITSFEREAKQNQSYQELTGAAQTQLNGLAVAHHRVECSDDPVQAYFDKLVLALEDCAENLQWNCTCPLPTPPDVAPGEKYMLTLTLETKEATAKRFTTHFTDSTPPRFTDINAVFDAAFDEKPADYDPKKDIQRVTFVLSEHGLLWSYRYYAPQDINGGFKSSRFRKVGGDFVFDKDTRPEAVLTFREPHEHDETCAVIKTKYAFCANLTDEAPPLQFSLENKERRPPPPPQTPPQLLVARAVPKPACFNPCNYWVCAGGIPTGVVNPQCNPPYNEVPQALDAYYDPLTGYFLLRQPQLDQALYLVYMKDPRTIPPPSNPFNRDAQQIVGQLRYVRDENDSPFNCIFFNINDLEIPRLWRGAARPDFWKTYSGYLYLVPVDRAGNANIQQPLRLRVTPLRKSDRDWHPLDDDELPLVGAPAYSDDKGLAPQMNFVRNWQLFCPDSAPLIPLILNQPGSLPITPLKDFDDTLWSHLPAYKQEQLRRQYDRA
ncbi:hypothetical protein D6789_01180 [Candidatus Woesearchaeota archaeon]|nr:MAG: hypothetical protein D6789_01180 [Candidatus Woesearchaeota archaeon]